MSLGRTLIVLGLILIAVGVLLTFGIRLPGDILIRRKNSVFYFPVVTCLLISVILTFIAWLFRGR